MLSLILTVWHCDVALAIRANPLSITPSTQTLVSALYPSHNSLISYTTLAGRYVRYISILVFGLGQITSLSVDFLLYGHCYIRRVFVRIE